MRIFTTIATVLFMACASLYAQVDLDNGLIASYPFNGDATDASGNELDGTVTAGYTGWGGGTPVLTADRFGNADKAYYFDQGGNIEIPYSTILNPEMLSLSWWIKMEERPNNDYMISLNKWNCYKVNLQESNKVFFTTKVDDPDNPGLFIYNDRDHAGDGLLADTWYHLAVSFGGGHMKFYIDGALVKDWDDVPSSSIVDISADPVNLILGQQKPTSVYVDEAGDGEFFKGIMDDFRFYNRILTDDEVMALYELTDVDVDVDLEDGLVASYPFNGDATDVSGNELDGTVTAGYTGWGGGTPVLTADRFGNADKAYYFDQGGNIEIPYSTILNPEMLSMSWWIKMEERPNNDYMISLNKWNCYKVNLQESNKVFFTTKVDDPDNPGLFIYNDRDHAGDGLLADTWYHLAVSFGGGHMKFYIDGALVKDWDDVPNSSIVDISADPVNLILGQQKPTSVYVDEAGDGEFFKGTMDDFRFYNRVLSDDEVMALYELTDVDLEDGLVASYPFNGDATDVSGNELDGTVTAGYTGWGGGTPTLTTDRAGNANQAYYFDQGGNIEIPYSTILNPETLSMSWWIKMEERANNDYMISLNKWNCYKVNLQESNKVFFTTKVDDPDNPGLFIYNDRDHAGEGLLADTWYHLAVSFGGGHMKFYIDGALVKDWDDVPNSSIVDISADPVNLILGQQKPTSVYVDEAGDGEFFKGTMDDFRFYNRVLSDAEVLALFAMVPVSADASLSALSVDVGTLDPAFDPATTSYTLEVHADTTAINITATVNDPNATVTGDGEFITIPGTATVTITAADGITTKDYTIAVSYIVGIDQLSVRSVGLYPNPASQYIMVSLNEKYVGSEMIIMDIAGRVVHSEIYRSARQAVDISGLQSGLYLLKANVGVSNASASFIVE